MLIREKIILQRGDDQLMFAQCLYECSLKIVDVSGGFLFVCMCAEDTRSSRVLKTNLTK